MEAGDDYCRWHTAARTSGTTKPNARLTDKRVAGLQRSVLQQQLLTLAKETPAPSHSFFVHPMPGPRDNPEFPRAWPPAFYDRKSNDAYGIFVILTKHHPLIAGTILTPVAFGLKGSPHPTTAHA